jgi:hypothetical protein
LNGVNIIDVMYTYSVRKNLQRGEGESSVLLTIFGVAIALSIGYYVVLYIQEVKESRLKGKAGTATDENRPPPRSIEDVGGYEITY